MRASHIGVRDTEDQTELSATLDGFRLWYRFPQDCPVEARGDAFVAAGLLAAMRAGENLVIDDAPVSPRLLAATTRIQQILHRWDAAFQLIDVQAETEVPEVRQDGVASFFSGGVDGTYTFMRHAPTITHLVFVRGIDIQLDNEALLAQVLAANRRFAEAAGKTLLPVTTNIREFCHPRGLPWGSWFSGAGLASIALTLGFPRMYVASSRSYEHMQPSGTHPLLDPLWSTEATDIIHDGCEAARGDKLRAIGQVPGALELLRVCWHDAGYNCGHCEKCLRTMLALRLLGLHSSTLPPLDDLTPIARLRVEADQDVFALRDNRRLAQQAGDIDALKMIDRILNRYRIRRALIDLDAAITGGHCKDAWRRLTFRRGA